MDDKLENNRNMWNALTGAHITSSFYDVDGFKAGKSSLSPIETKEMGDVAGKSLLHLQCHFGMDTLSWSRLGANATGVDFSDEAISYARQLADDIQQSAQFLCSDIYALPKLLDRQFDIVYTSYGVLSWLPDLQKWAALIKRYLKPGGFFYIAEIHPIIVVYYNQDQCGDNSGLKIRNTYFPQGTERYDGGRDYASDFSHDLTSYEWQHTVADVASILADAGLHIDFLHEHPACCHQALPEMKQDADGMWRLPGDPLPLTFSIKATKVV